MVVKFKSKHRHYFPLATVGYLSADGSLTLHSSRKVSSLKTINEAIHFLENFILRITFYHEHLKNTKLYSIEF